MELILGAMIVALLVKAVPAAIVDAVTTLRAATAGEWGLIDKQRDRKHEQAKSRREALSKAWQATRTTRNRKAGGTGAYRPGAKAYFGDVYHGLWEDQLEKRHAKRAARLPIGPDGKRPLADRLDAAVEAKVDRHRQDTGMLGRVARTLWEPVGEPRQPADVVPPRTDRTGSGGADANSAGRPDPFNPPPTPPADGPRTACPVSGDTLTPVDGGWRHPDGSACLLGHPLTEAGESQEEPAVDPPFRYEPARPQASDTTQNQSSNRNTNSNGGTAMNTATGDVHDVETCKSECTALADDLGRVDAALDSIDEAIRQAANATEHIEGWLQSKNADACVPGMSAALDALSSDRIKELIDAVAAAKLGVADTIDNLVPLEEAAELVGATDGSALNGR